jgi:hypothetical protein
MRVRIAITMTIGILIAVSGLVHAQSESTFILFQPMGLLR